MGDTEGNLQAFDVRQEKPSQAALNVHDKKINTIHVSTFPDVEEDAKHDWKLPATCLFVTNSTMMLCSVVKLQL